MTMLQIRHIPDEMHRKLKSRAALLGMSLSDYALGELRKSLERPTRSELLNTLAARPVQSIVPSPTDAIRSERDVRARR